MNGTLFYLISLTAFSVPVVDGAEKTQIVEVADCDLSLDGLATVRVDVPSIQGATVYIAALVEDNKITRFFKLEGIQEAAAREIVMKDVSSGQMKGDYVYIRAKRTLKERIAILYIRGGFVVVPLKTSDGKSFDLKVPREKFRFGGAEEKLK
jgi:hypothetical protein